MKTISPEAAIKEVATYCNSLEYIEYTTVVNFVSMYFDIVEKEHHTFLISEVIKFLETNIDLIIPYPSDVVRIENELSRMARLHGKYVMRKDGRNRIFEPLFKAKTVELPKPNIKITYTQKPKQTEAEITERRSLIENTIDEYLDRFKGDVISIDDYIYIITVLTSFFNGEKAPTIKPCFVKYGNKKKLAYELGRIHRGLEKGAFSFEYFDLCRQLFDCYTNEIIDEIDPSKSNLHKYFTTKTQ